jgi:hypothetical protein
MGQARTLTLLWNVSVDARAVPVAAVCDCRLVPRRRSQSASTVSFGGHRPPLQMRAFCLAYFFFGFLAPDFLAELPDDFFALLLDSDFNLAFADFEAEDFLEPLPFFSTF